jgi:hypothetical protein
MGQDEIGTPKLEQENKSLRKQVEALRAMLLLLILNRLQSNV